MADRRPTTPRASGPGRGKGVSGSGRSSAAGPGVGSRRPAVSARPRSAPAAVTASSGRGPRGLPRRAAVFATLLLLVAAASAPNLRDYVGQQAELVAVEDELAARQARVADLEDQLERWQDPAFVAQQARQRFGFVMPGEVGYIVLDPPTAADANPSVVAAEEGAAVDRAWFGSLWASIEQAGAEVQAGAPAPAPASSGATPAPPPPDPVPAPGP